MKLSRGLILFLTVLSLLSSCGGGRKDSHKVSHNPDQSSDLVLKITE